MRIFLTTCTADKDPRPQPLRADRRYRGARVVAARERATDMGVPLFFLSGVFGLVPAAGELPWYDHALQPDEVDGLVGPLTAELLRLGVVEIVALMMVPSEPGWAPYHRLLALGADAAGCRLSVHVWG